MSAPPAKMLVSVGANCAIVQINGRATFTSSIDFRTLLNELLQKGYAQFILDLTECVLMDSTFLGVLAGFALRMSGAQADRVERSIELFNPNPRIADLLENLGVLHLFKVAQGNVKLPEPAAPCNPSGNRASQEEVTRTCLEAHKTLMQLHPDNVARFKDVAQFLAEDLKRLKTEK